MRRKNVSTEFLKECIADAFLRLLKTRPAEKITIQEIADLADVGRVTYFRNFSSKPEVAIFKLTLLWKRWTEERKLGEEYTLDTAAEFFSFCYANRELLELLYASGLELTVYEAFYRVMMPQYERSARGLLPGPLSVLRPVRDAGRVGAPGLCRIAP